MYENENLDSGRLDGALSGVRNEILRLDPDGSRWAAVIRHTYDMVYNGQETGRYRWDQLMKTERTHFGTLFEINAQREFAFCGGDKTDFRIAGSQVDAKWSQTLGEWMLPPEIFGELALVATGSDEESRWSLGLIRVTSDVRQNGRNRDKKTQLNAVGRRRVDWLWHGAELRPNVLLQLPRETVDFIFDHHHGTERTNRLFRLAEGMIVNRNAVATVSRQLDAQRRVRYDRKSPKAGARSALRCEGFVILSGMYHRDLARSLRLPIPLSDEYISTRLVRANADEAQVVIDGVRWRRARSNEQVTEPAPIAGK